jgi:uncharacterized protein (DUF488 family)
VPAVVFTVGHSTHAAEYFRSLLTSHAVVTLADVRRFPMSRRHPQFNSDALAAALAGHGIAYAHFRDLGGRRDPAPDSVNTGWRNDSFRGYADYMATPAFRAAIDALLALPAPTVVMCAEALWWRCHRGLIADYLTAMAIEVRHIGGRGEVTRHTGTGPALIAPGSLAYSGPQQELFGGPHRSPDAGT